MASLEMISTRKNLEKLSIRILELKSSDNLSVSLLSLID